MKRREKGQGLVEYALILVLISIVVIVILTVLGPRAGNVFESVKGLTTESPSITQIEAHSNISPSAENDFDEIIEPFREAALLQEERLHEGTDLTVEAFVEFLEVVIEHVDEIGNEAAAEALSALRQAFLDGNFDEIEELVDSFPEDLDLVEVLTDLPEEVQIAAAEKMLPRFEQASQTLSEGIVPEDLINGTIAAVDQQLPDDHPNKTEVLQLLNEARELVLVRNEAVEQILTYLNPVITQLQVLLDGQ